PRSGRRPAIVAPGGASSGDGEKLLRGPPFARPRVVNADRHESQHAALRIAARRLEILELWRVLARSRPAAAGLDRLELDDGMPDFLDKLAEYLATPEPDEHEALDVPPVLHAHQRLRGDF